MENKICLVTGATSGHGRAVARALARMGAEVVLLGRSRQRCLETQRETARQTGNRPSFLLCDLGSRAESRSTSGTYPMLPTRSRWATRGAVR